jgi:hypothetical protein
VTFYIWKKKYAHLGVSELRRLRSLEDENGRLKRLVADLSLDKHILSEALRKRSEAHTAPRAGGLGPSDLRRQLRAGLSSGAVQSCGVVSQLEGCEGKAAEGCEAEGSEEAVSDDEVPVKVYEGKVDEVAFPVPLWERARFGVSKPPTSIPSRRTA